MRRAPNGATTRLLALLLASSLGGCSWFSKLPGLNSAPPPEPTLADLVASPPETDEPLVNPLLGETVAPVSLEELEARYREVLAVAHDPELRFQVRRRLADLEMMASEAEMANAGTSASYAKVIESYKTLLEEYPEAEGSDVLLYQMARAHDLQGEGDRAVELMEQLSEDYPESEHIAEAEFRKGESSFSAGDFGLAEQAYSRVVEAGPKSDYFDNGLYMMGWARFKQGMYPQAAEAFVGTLDELMPTDNQLSSLERGDREMASDCLRMLAVIYSYQGGSEAVAAGFAEMGERSYQYLVYQSLGQLYLQQERYQDSAETFAGFVAAYPASPVAHDFQWHVIQVYLAGGFPQKVIDAKEQYVADYSVNSTYWRQARASQREVIEPRLQVYIDELASYHHQLAQQGTGAEADGHYLAAADYYALYVESFPQDAGVPDRIFLMAEAREAAGDNRRAIHDYEWMAYAWPEHSLAPEAAYAGILAYDALENAAPEDQQALIESQLRFAHTFSGDAHAPAVLGQAAALLLQTAQYQQAVIAADELVQWSPDPGIAVTIPALLILGHSQFQLADYAAAEQAYGRAINTMPADDARRADSAEQLAASIYRQGEAATASGDLLAAADHYARVIALAPTSEIRINAQYDAAASYRSAGDLAQANALLIDFRERFPENTLSAGVAAILVENYEASGDWAAAAAELDRINRESTDPAVQRESLYLAAEYYLKANDAAQAVGRLQRYADEWPEPLSLRLEAMAQMAELYDSGGEPALRSATLQAMGQAFHNATATPDERSRFLAASATSELADGFYAQYLAIQLTNPLKQSLQRKRQSMQQAVNAYEQVNAYGLQAFGTRATFRLGEIYHRLATDLMASERPDGLDALALEQYELLLEEQAWPFEEKAVAIHRTNAERAWTGLYDQWIAESFASLGELMPARWGKREMQPALYKEIR